MCVVLLVCWLDSSEYQNLLPCYLITAGVQQPDAVVFGYVVDSLPLILLNLIHFNLIYEFEWLTVRHVVNRCAAVLKLLASESEYVLVVEGAHTEALFSMIHLGDLGPFVFLHVVHLA